jgi:hypothetical protein
LSKEEDNMKYFLFAILVMLMLSCTDNPPQPVITTKDCPLPVQLTDPNSMPIGMHYASKLSPDGTKLFYSPGGVGVNILDLRTLSVSLFDITPLIPKNSKLALAGVAPIIHWCPYDNSRFVVIARLGVDTIGDGKKYPGGYHLIICSINSTYYKDITPKNFLPIGSGSPIRLDGWLRNSYMGNDWFLIGYKLNDFGESYYSSYNPMTQELLEQEYKGLIAYSSDWKYQYFGNHDSSFNPRYYINDKELIFKDIDSTDLSYATFSPDGMHFAIAANVYDKTKQYDSTSRLAEVWIIDVEEFMRNPVQPVPVKIINIKEKFCMFSYGLHPVFTSNNKLAVSMFKAGDTFSYLNEIDLDGNYIRQLTFSP